jgi:hypothetical protein
MQNRVCFLAVVNSFMYFTRERYRLSRPVWRG